MAAHQPDRIENPPLPGKESCPGNLTWSAFGATYPDTVCASTLTWADGHRGWGLCDADDDFRESGIPCPFCDWEAFVNYQWSVDDGETALLWASDETPVSKNTEIHFHDGQTLWWTATHPERGEERVLMRSIIDYNENPPFQRFASEWLNQEVEGES